jgi:hypothetical protein
MCRQVGEKENLGTANLTFLLATIGYDIALDMSGSLYT